MSKEKTKIPSVIIKTDGIEFTDKDIKIVKLESGTYDIGGEIIEVDCPYYKKQSVVVKNTSDIRKITTEKYIEKYTNGSDFMSVEDYKDKCIKLYDKYDSEDEKWETLDDEFNYRKFKDVWKPVYNTIQSVSKPLKVGIVKTQYDTGCKYIQNAYLSDNNKDATLFVYDQNKAWLDILSECFTELGMTYEGDCGYNKTNNKKIWGNSDHSCIRFAVAFGTYCMNDSWGNPRRIKGTLEDVKRRYNEDKKTIRSIIINKYNKHFGRIDENSFDFDGLLSKINNCILRLDNIEPKQKSYTNYYHLKNKLKECSDMVSVAYDPNK